MIFNMIAMGASTGGGGDVYAFIQVTYPAGSVCSASNGTITLTASTTSGSYVFRIPTPANPPEIWTVSCTDGTDNASTTVAIFQEGQSVSIELTYLVPSAYQAVQFLEAAQNRNIVFDTGITPAASDFVSVRFMILSTTSTPALFGSSGYYATFTSVINLYRGSTNTSYPYNLSQVYEVQFVGGNMVRWSEDGGQTFTDASFVASSTGSYSFALFSMKNGANSYLTTNLAASKRIYRAKIQDAEFVPCYRKSDNVPGFWNRRDAVFITNVQDGTVTIGPNL